MVEGEEGEIFAGECGGAVEGDGEAFIANVGEGFGMTLAVLEEKGACGEIGNIEPEEIEESEGEAFEARVFICGFDGFEEFSGLRGRRCAEFEQEILAGAELVGDFRFQCGGAFHEILKRLGRVGGIGQGIKLGK